MRNSVLAGAILASAFFVSGASASVIITPTTYAGCLGNASCIIGGATLTAKPTPDATFSEQDFRGLQGLGVNFQNSGARNEIQGQLDEMIEIDFGTIPDANSAPISLIQLGQFYNPDAFSGSDEPIEIAILEFDLGALGTETITIRNESNADDGFTVETSSIAATQATGNQVTLDGVGIFTRETTDNSGQGDQGLFTIEALIGSGGLFGGAGVHVLTLMADPTPSGTGGEGSDYSLASLTSGDPSITAVPVPAALPLLIGAMAGLGLMGRRRRSAA